MRRRAGGRIPHPRDPISDGDKAAEHLLDGAAYATRGVVVAVGKLCTPGAWVDVRLGEQRERWGFTGYFTKLFHAEYGYPPSEYVRKRTASK